MGFEPTEAEWRLLPVHASTSKPPRLGFILSLFIIKKQDIAKNSFESFLWKLYKGLHLSFHVQNNSKYSNSPNTGNIWIPDILNTGHFGCQVFKWLTVQRLIPFLCCLDLVFEQPFENPTRVCFVIYFTIWIPDH